MPFCPTVPFCPTDASGLTSYFSFNCPIRKIIKKIASCPTVPFSPTHPYTRQRVRYSSYTRIRANGNIRRGNFERPSDERLVRNPPTSIGSTPEPHSPRGGVQTRGIRVDGIQSGIASSRLCPASPSRDSLSRAHPRRSLHIDDSD